MEMKKAVCLVIVVIALFIAAVSPVHAGGHGYGGHGHSSFRGSVWIGPGWGSWGWGYPAYPYYNPYYYAEPPVVIEERPSAYVQPTPQEEEPYYWYFCPDAKNYYPYVKKCPKGWLRVVPSQNPPDWRE